MMFLALIYALFGRFIHSVGYTNKYEHYEKFNEEIWGKPYIKFPVYIGMALGLSLMCLIKDMNKLKFFIIYRCSRCYLLIICSISRM